MWIFDTVHLGTEYRSSSKFKVISQISRSQEKNVAEAVDATSSKGFLV